MNFTQQSYIEDPGKFKQIVWDYSLTPEEFFAILSDEKKDGFLGRDWAIGRILEHVPYYDAIELVPISIIKSRWQQLKPKIFNKEIKKGYEYLLHKYTLSAAR